MIVIYTQDKTFIRNDADAAREDLVSLYGEKFGKEAYVTVKSGRVGASYRKNGGPLVIITDREKTEIIRKQETKIDMLE